MHIYIIFLIKLLYILVKCNLASFLMMTETQSKARLLKCLFSELPLFCTFVFYYHEWPL